MSFTWVCIHDWLYGLPIYTNIPTHVWGSCDIYDKNMVIGSKALNTTSKSHYICMDRRGSLVILWNHYNAIVCSFSTWLLCIINMYHQFNSLQFNVFVIYGYRPKIHIIQYNNIWVTWSIVQSITLQIKYKI